MIRKAFRSGVLAGLIGCGALSPSFATELRAFDLQAGTNSAQLTLDLTDGTTQRLFTLEHPDRVVLDLPHTHLARGARAPRGAGVVTAVRVGPQPHGTLRVVIELQSALPAHSTRSVSPVDGERLILSVGEPAVASAEVAGPKAAHAVHAPGDAAHAVHPPGDGARAAHPPGDGERAARAVPAPGDGARDTKAVRAMHAPGDGERDVIIAVDAGHGGVDPGAIGHGGTREKNVTLAIARALADRINAEPGMHAVLTRNRDEFLELRDRIARAHAAHADMFVSVHADSIADRSVTGASVYVLSAHGASSEAAKLLAERENAADLMGGVLEDQGALRPVLLDAAQSEIIGLSATAAEGVVAALGNVGEIRKAQVQQAGFVVLKSPDIPSMLVETAYISNPAEERRLRSSEQQGRLAEAIASGVRSYFVQNPPDGTRFKAERRMASAASTGEATTASATH